ncbi:hypothetical protein HY251_01980 [bacterium]|nr:hypothetical protein [bacterium]
MDADATTETTEATFVAKKPKKTRRGKAAPRKREGAFLLYLEPDLRGRLEEHRVRVEREHAAKVEPGFRSKVTTADVVRAAIVRAVTGSPPPLPTEDFRALGDRIVKIVEYLVKQNEDERPALSGVRHHLAGVFREHQDAALIELDRAGRIALGAARDPRKLDDEDRQASIEHAERGLLAFAQIPTNEK